MTPNILSFLLAILFLSSCSKSLVYSPSINLPKEMLQEKEIDFSGGVELMPEARAEKLGGRPTTMGINGQLGYGINDNFNISLKGWLDISERGFNIRSGYSMACQIIKPKNIQSRFIFLPRLGMVLDGNNISGYGVSSSIIYQEEMSERFSFYLGGGILWGIRSFEKIANDNDERRIPMGFGLIGHTGAALKISNAIRINFEITPIIQLNSFDKNHQVILSPQIGVGYTIRNRKKK